MKNDWNIADNLAGVPLEMMVITSESDKIWPYFFNGMSVDNYPEIINLVSEEIGYGFNGTGVNFPQGLLKMAPHEPSIPGDAVEIYLAGFDNEDVIPRATFYAVLAEFGQRLVERPGQPLAWYAAMQAALAKLRAKMAADAAA